MFEVEREYIAEARNNHMDPPEIRMVFDQQGNLDRRRFVIVQIYYHINGSKIFAYVLTIFHVDTIFHVLTKLLLSLSYPMERKTYSNTPLQCINAVVDCGTLAPWHRNVIPLSIHYFFPAENLGGTTTFKVHT